MMVSGGYKRIILVKSTRTFHVQPNTSDTLSSDDSSEIPSEDVKHLKCLVVTLVTGGVY